MAMRSGPGAGKVDQVAQDNLRRMHELDDAWNAQDRDVVAEFHADDVVVDWPGGNPPTKGNPAHIAESKEYAKTFPDNRLENRPYKVEFGQATGLAPSRTGSKARLWRRSSSRTWSAC